MAVDGNENMKPMKNKSIERIDPTVAQINAMAGAIKQEHRRSVYESRGMRAILDVFGTLDAAETLRMLAKAGYGEGCRLIPYRAIGTDHGLLLALRADSVRENEMQQEGALIALTETDLSAETGCGAVTGA